MKGKLNPHLDIDKKMIVELTIPEGSENNGENSSKLSK